MDVCILVHAYVYMCLDNTFDKNKEHDHLELIIRKGKYFEKTYNNSHRKYSI